MRFMLDENVARSVQNQLIKMGHDAQYIRDIIPQGSADPLVAFVSEDYEAVLISHDGDFKTISPRIPDGQRKRFRSLSRIHLQCAEYQASQRLEKAISLISHEFDIAQNSHDKRMMIVLSTAFIKSVR